ncbi:hypothetical protein [Devosia faecipullorum]|uniref:hypothetical protein n=1 Tax=Devosia faecipullorum TaxID=2755039 RepID=UPI00187B3E95|nr:hypothetical protein [Devosia faecipullorum]MBE7732158.1 hypothetical protein [Devosia faecipullorum]
MKVEFRIKKIERYIVTRFEQGFATDGEAVVATFGTYDNADQAHHVAMALARDQANRLGIPLNHPSIVYPRKPSNRA